MHLRLGFVCGRALLSLVLGVSIIGNSDDSGFHVGVRAESGKGLEERAKFSVLKEGSFLVMWFVRIRGERYCNRAIYLRRLVGGRR